MHEVSTSGHREPLTNDDFTSSTDPIALFRRWFDEAAAQEINDPNAMAVATADADLMPNVRVVLLKSMDENGFVFFSNSESQKGGELAANPQAAAVFHWKSLRRQVRIRGGVQIVTGVDADTYFESRPRDSRIGAWASQQSRPLESRARFEAEIAETAARYEGGAVPRPPHWHGYRIVPISIEFWQDRPFRMHDRIVFTRASAAEDWSVTRLYP